MSNRPNRKPSPSARVAKAHAAKTSRPVAIYVAVGIAIVAALVIAIVVAGRGSETPPLSIKGGGTIVPQGEIVFGDVAVDGEPLPALPETGGADPALGKATPTVTGVQFNDKALTIPGKGAKVVIFLAHWCPHCQAEVPVISNELATNGLPADVPLYAVATSTSDQRPNYPPASWLHKESWPVPTLVDNAKNTAAAAYGVTTFPYFVVTDSSGNVVKRTSGELSVEQFRALIEEAR